MGITRTKRWKGGSFQRMVGEVNLPEMESISEPFATLTATFE
jgi:hypothetical protein